MCAETGAILFFGDVDKDGVEDLNFNEKLLKSDLVLPPDPGFVEEDSSVSQDEETDDPEAAEEVLPRLLGREDSGFNVPKSDVEDDRIRPNLLFGTTTGVVCFSVVSLASFDVFSGRFDPEFDISWSFFSTFSSFSAGFSFIGSFTGVLLVEFKVVLSLDSVSLEITLERRSLSMFALFNFFVSFFDFPRNNQSTSPLVTPES